jgi:outer membrane lipoprotein SlyB
MLKRPSPSTSAKFKSRPPSQDASTSNEDPVGVPTASAAIQEKGVPGGETIENVSPLLKGPYNSLLHMTYPESVPPYRNKMDSTPFSQKHSFCGGSMNVHCLRVPLRKQLTSPKSLQNSVGEEVGAGVGEDVGESVGETVGEEVGSLVGDAVGSLVGDAVGSLVGEEVGSLVGEEVGSLVGEEVGSLVGDAVGSLVGDAVGSLVGDAVGSLVGEVVGEEVGDCVGPLLGDEVGEPVGVSVGGNVV